MKTTPERYYNCPQFAGIRKDRLYRLVWVCRALLKKTHTRKQNEVGNTFPKLPHKPIVTPYRHQTAFHSQVFTYFIPNVKKKKKKRKKGCCNQYYI